MVPMTAHATLEHPLPAGMRDLLPPEAALRRAIARSFLGRAELFGYEIVIPPVFEYAQTIERGLGTLDPREIVRFVEPETGEVVALRPDVTPQIARLVATRFDGKPPPYRLAYDASVLRRRFGARARTHRQISQLGVELIGVHALAGDVELLVLAATALATMGLAEFTVDLGHADLARSLLAGLDARLADAIADALSKKDRTVLGRLSAELPAATREALLLLPTLHGDPSLLETLPEVLVKGPTAPAIGELRTLVRDLRTSLAHTSNTSAGGARITVDLGEVRGLAYYTGPFYQLFAEGPGVAIGAGGRYDQLLARFDRPLPASGFALDVDALLWALRAADAELLRRPRRVIVTGEGASAFAATLRASGIPAAVAETHAEEYARAWGYTHIARVRGTQIALSELPVLGVLADAELPGAEIEDAQIESSEVAMEAALARLSQFG